MDSLNFKVLGQGRPLIVIHGLFGSLDNWQTLGRRWSEDLEVYLIDLPNHGRSPHSDTHSYTFLADQIFRLIEEQEIKNPVILGHSMGGKVVFEIIRQRPEFLEKAIVVDILPITYEPSHHYIFRAMKSLNMHAETRTELHDQLSQAIGSQSVVQFILKSISRKMEGGYEWKLNLDVLIKEYDRILEDIPLDIYNTELMLIGGGQSDYITEEGVEDLRQHFPYLLYESIPEVGHWVHAQAPSKLEDLVRSFLDI